MVLHKQPKFIAVDEQPDDDIMHLGGFRKADRLAHQPLGTSMQRLMLTLDLLRMAFAWGVDCGIEIPRVRAPMIRVLARDAKEL